MKLLKSTLKSLNDFQKILLIFFVWRIILFLISYLATFAIPVWGGWYPYVDRALSVTGLQSWVWSWGGFDGVHYLRLAQNGYNYQGSQAFFPVFPALINLVSRIIPVKNFLDPSFFVNTNFFYSGLLISNVLALLALYYAKKIFDLEYGEKISWKVILFLLVFPTSFYMGAIYTESLFILLAVLTLYSYKKENYLLAGLFGALTSAIKVLGVFIPLILVIDGTVALVKKQEFKKNVKILSAGLFGGVGLLGYMLYLQYKFSDALLFLHVQSGFGAERSSTPLIILPQVFYRYIKIFIAIPPTEMRFYNALFELVMTALAFLFLFLAIKKIKLSYWISIFGMLLVPTLTGTLSSMPRYILTAFILFPFVVVRLKKAYTPAVIIMGLLAVICIALFTRGYWVA